jgi:hypothetical protein
MGGQAGAEQTAPEKAHERGPYIIRTPKGERSPIHVAFDSDVSARMVLQCRDSTTSKETAPLTRYPA